MHLLYILFKCVYHIKTEGVLKLWMSFQLAIDIESANILISLVELCEFL